MEKITKEKFLKNVRIEVEALKLHATQEELSSLNFKWFNYHKEEHCIYGQMTGDCTSVRAKELMDKACVRVLKTLHGVSSIAKKKFDTILEFSDINKYTGQTWEYSEYNARNYNFLSMLEAYICLKGSKPENIIAYLKGEVDILELSLD